MDMRRHFGARDKEKEAKDDFGSVNQEECRSTHSWFRSTPVSAQKRKFALEDFPIFIISP